jgi:hypothetical protein
MKNILDFKGWLNESQMINESYAPNHWIESAKNDGTDTYNFVKIQFSVAAAAKLGFSTASHLGGRSDWDRNFVTIQFPKTIKDVKSLQTYIEAGKANEERLLYKMSDKSNKYNNDAKAKLEPMKTSYSYKGKDGKTYTKGPFANPDNWYQMVCEAAIGGVTA